MARRPTLRLNRETVRDLSEGTLQAIHAGEALTNDGAKVCHIPLTCIGNGYTCTSIPLTYYCGFRAG